MKKIIRMLLVSMLFLLTTEVCAIDNQKLQMLSYQDENLMEEIIPNRDKNGIIQSFDFIITIPENYQEEEIVIQPKIMGGISQYKKLDPNKEIKTNLKIINQSFYNYNYVDNSFILSTEDIKQIDQNNNFIDTKSIGFDNRKIYDVSSVYRVFNNAIISLYKYNALNPPNKEDLKDEALSIKLKEKGYAGVEELDKYYLDFYNNKYNLKETNLNDFTPSTIKEIFTGEIIELQETNNNIIKLAYDYFYNHVLLYHFSDNERLNDNQYSIASYMKNDYGNNYLKLAFSDLRNKTYKEINNMGIYLNINKNNCLNSYNSFLHFEFKLSKENVEESINKLSGLIEPPKTGIY